MFLQDFIEAGLVDFFQPVNLRCRRLFLERLERLQHCFQFGIHANSCSINFSSAGKASVRIVLASCGVIGLLATAEDSSS